MILDIQAAKGAEAAREIGGVFVEGDVAEEVPVQAAVDAAAELGPLRVLSTRRVLPPGCAQWIVTASRCRSISSAA